MAVPPLLPPDVDHMELTDQERRSRTKGEFWIPEKQRQVYQKALHTLNQAGIPYVVSGAFAIHHYTGIYRETKDLDLFLEPKYIVAAAHALKQVGFEVKLQQAHWIAKALVGEDFVDLIFGMGNGLGFIDDSWHRHGQQAILAAEPIRVAPPEDMIWHRLFISERHRYDMADIVHLILALEGHIDWNRLLVMTGEHWPLLLTHLILFRYVYPEFARYVPDEVMKDLLDRQKGDLQRACTQERITRGTLISLFSFQIDVKEWGFRDMRHEAIERVLEKDIVRQIAGNPVWDNEGETPL